MVMSSRLSVHERSSVTCFSKCLLKSIHALFVVGNLELGKIDVAFQVFWALGVVGSRGNVSCRWKQVCTPLRVTSCFPGLSAGFLCVTVEVVRGDSVRGASFRGGSERLNVALGFADVG